MQKIDCYEVLKKLGEGSSGDVFLVQKQGQSYALKLLRKITSEFSEDLISAFKFEFGLLKDLRHPHVVQIFDFGFDEKLERFYFTEEFLEGQNIREFCKDKSAELILNLLVQCLEGMQAIHQAGFLHGDIKSTNIWVISSSEGPQVKLIDLGLSDPRFGSASGTPSTIAPEKIMRDPVDERSDLYSLAVAFYELWGGKNPFLKESISETYQAHLSDLAPQITLKNPKVPVFLNEILSKLLSKNPAHRYRNCAQVLEALSWAQSNASQGSAWQSHPWAKREALIQETQNKIEHLMKGKNAKVLLLVGEKGVGKSRLAQEMKYSFQMKRKKVFESHSHQENEILPPAGTLDLWIIQDWDQWLPERKEEIFHEFLHREQKPVLLFTLSSASEAEIVSQLKQNHLEYERQVIHPFSFEELHQFLIEMSQLREIPKNFLEGIWKHTQGNPALLSQLLKQLFAKKNIVGPDGSWNLSVFKEAEFDDLCQAFEWKDFDHLLQNTPPEEYETRAELLLKKSEELLKAKEYVLASESLKEADGVIQKIKEVSRRLPLRIHYHEKKAWQEMRHGFYDEALLDLERALSLQEESAASDELFLIRMHNFKAWIFLQKGKVEEAIEIFLKQKERAKLLPFEEQKRIFNNELGAAYLQKGETDLAIQTFLGDLNFYEKSEELNSQIKTHYNLAGAYQKISDQEKSIHHYSRTAELARNRKDYDFLLRAYNGLGSAYQAAKDLEKALEYYSKAFDLAKYLQDYLSAGTIAQNIGSLHAEKSEYDLAEHFFDLSLQVIEKVPQKSSHSSYLQCRALLEKGDLERKKENDEQALVFVGQAEQVARQEKLHHFMFWVLYTRCLIEKKLHPGKVFEVCLAELHPWVNDEEKRKLYDEISGRVEKKVMIETAPSGMGDVNKEKLLERICELEKENETLKKQLEWTQVNLEKEQKGWLESTLIRKFASAKLITQSESMRKVFELIDKIRDTDLSIFISGESGTGKELVARSLHDLSRRASFRFVAINCAALPEALLESELFGFKVGAFTGAQRDKKGLIEEAEGGTLFLDEISELPLLLQAKLLRVIQEKELIRVGENIPRKVNFRVLSASHKKLSGEVETGKFREDLFYRVCEMEIEIPALRERKEDIPLLAEEFIRRSFAEEKSEKAPRLSKELMQAFMNYDWPGNVRELESFVKVALALQSGKHLQLKDLPQSYLQRLEQNKKSVRRENLAPLSEMASLVPSKELFNPSLNWVQMEELFIAKALLHYQEEVAATAQALSCAPSKIYQRIREGRLSERKAEFEKHPYTFVPGQTLKEVKQEIFKKALDYCQGKVYQAAHLLQVSPAIVYKWVKGDSIHIL